MQVTLPLKVELEVPTPFELDIREFASITPWTSGSNGTDIGPIIDMVADEIRSNFFPGRGTIKLPPGMYRIATPPTPSKLTGHYISGAGHLSTILIYDNNTGACFAPNASGAYNGGGFKDFTLRLQSGVGASSAYGIRLVGDSSYQPDHLVIDHVMINALNSSDSWEIPFEIDGTARTSPQGNRETSIRWLQLFNGRTRAARISAAVALDIMNIGSYTGIGSTGNDIEITGAGTSTTNSLQVFVHSLQCNGTFRVNNCGRGYAMGHAASVNKNGSTAANFDVSMI